MDEERVYHYPGDGLGERDSIYVQILHVGLISLKNASHAGNAEYWRFESEHLHNLPSLIGEPNELRHDYYFDKERTHYLERVQCCDTDTTFARIRYEELWNRLQALRARS